MANLSEIIKNNDLIAEQSTVPSQFAMHALTRDADGLLTYTKVLWNGSETIDLSTGAGLAFSGVEEFVQGANSEGTKHNETRIIDENASTDTQTNLKNRQYEQVRFDGQKLTYFINSQGFLVARYVQDYSHSGPV